MPAASDIQTASQFQPAFPRACAAMLDAAEPLQGAHAIVLGAAGTAGVDALCGLIGRGCDAATELPLDARVPMEPVEVVLVPRVVSLEQADQAVQAARRSLLPCGRVVMMDSDGALAAGIAVLLRAHGFFCVRSRATEAGVMISADRPMFGPRLGVSRHA